MSWQAYVDTQLIATGQVKQAALLSCEDASVWASTPDFMPRTYDAPITLEDGSDSTAAVNEAEVLVKLMNTGEAGLLGLRVNGEKYQILRTYHEPAVTVYGKKKRGGICITRTNMVLVVGVYDENENQTSGGCNLAVEKLGDYLRDNGL